MLDYFCACPQTGVLEGRKLLTRFKAMINGIGIFCEKHRMLRFPIVIFISLAGEQIEYEVARDCMAGHGI
jgi:hypothetical protein